MERLVSLQGVGSDLVDILVHKLRQSVYILDQSGLFQLHPPAAAVYADDLPLVNPLHGFFHVDHCRHAIFPGDDGAMR